MPERLRPIVTLASWCALWFGETVELRRGDIDLSEEVIRTRRAAVRTGGTFQITTPKSDAGIRDVNIPRTSSRRSRTTSPNTLAGAVIRCCSPQAT